MSTLNAQAPGDISSPWALLLAFVWTSQAAQNRRVSDANQQAVARRGLCRVE